MRMNRDKTIDRLRGFAMLWVIVVHVLYWGNFFTNEYVNLLKSFCLFEMPLFFFVAGASSSFSKDTGYFTYVCKRFQRILIPYWVFAVICATLSILKYALEGTMDFLAGVRVLSSWMLPIDRQITSVSYLTWALWFVPVYLCIALMLPALKAVKKVSHANKTIFALMGGVFSVTCVLKLGWVQNIAFYAFWTYAGLFYKEIKCAVQQKGTRKYFVYISAAGAVAIGVLYFAGCSLNMQSNKFLPNMIFFAFSVMMMALIMLAVPYLSRIFDRLEKNTLANKFFVLFSTRSMTIFYIRCSHSI